MLYYYIGFDNRRRQQAASKSVVGHEHISSNYVNGVVHWHMIKNFLTRFPELVNSGHSGPRVVGETLELTLDLLRFVLNCVFFQIKHYSCHKFIYFTFREVLIRLAIIIPIETAQLDPETPVSPLPNDASAFPFTPTAGNTSSSAQSSASIAAAGSGVSVVSSDMLTDDGFGGGRSSIASVDGDSWDGESFQDVYKQHWNFPTLGANDCYLLPALLTEPTPNHTTQSTGAAAAPNANYATQQHGENFAQKGSIRLERRFSFSRFVPSAIVPRIIAKMYSRFGHMLKTSSTQNQDSPDRNKCWRSSFIQEYGDCTVWILFEEGAAAPLGDVDFMMSPMSVGQKTKLIDRADVQNAIAEFVGVERVDPLGWVMNSTSFDKSSSFDFDPATLPGLDCDDPDKAHNDGYMNETEDDVKLRFSADDCNNDINCSTSSSIKLSAESSSSSSNNNNAYWNEDESGTRVVQLRIISFGHLMHVQNIVESLEDYSEAVYEILLEYRGVSKIAETTVCPVCLLKQ